MAAFCNFLQIPFSINPKPSSISPHRSSASSFHPRHPFPLCLFSTRPPSSPLISSNLEKPFPWIDPVESIVPTDPSLRHAKILFFRSAYNVQIVVNEDEPDEALLRRFRRQVSKAGVIQECKRRRFFENSHEEKKRKAREAGKRNRRRWSGPRFASPKDVDAAAKSSRHADDEDDNWEMPEGGLPI
ncbi:hypothetical protein AAC387_Pa01g2319 [Persea americana]